MRAQLIRTFFFCQNVKLEPAMERKSSEPKLIDGLMADLGGPRTARFLDAASKAVDFDRLASTIRAEVTSDQPKGGRPFWPVVVMIKCMLLAKWYGLSDPQLEEQLRDRLSFRRFVGLGLDDATPDETTFVKFRQRLRESQHHATLFDDVLDQLRGKGLVLKEGSLVDAMIIEAPRGHGGNGKDEFGESTRDRCATFTQKHGRKYHGYKAHVNVSVDRFITAYIFDSAKVHDSKHIDALIEGETKAVYADSAYMDKQRSARLAREGIHDGIVQRRVRGQKELSDEQRQHNRACSKVRALVEHPFAMLRQMGYAKVRFRGMLRNALDFAWMATACNIKRSLSLLGMALTPQRTAG
jgi:IS5 family transposase